MVKKLEPFKRNPFSALAELKLVPVPDPITVTHEPRVSLRNYLSRPDDPLRSLAEALSSGRKPKTVEVEKRLAPEPPDDEPEVKEPAAAPMKWGR